MRKKLSTAWACFHPTGHFEQDLEHILDLYIGKFSAKNPKWLAKPLQKRLKNS